MLEQLSTLFLLAEIFLVIHYRPVVEELADIILSADIGTVEAIQHRYGEQVNKILNEFIFILVALLRFRIV
jgi:hypothetical protein